MIEKSLVGVKGVDECGLVLVKIGWQWKRIVVELDFVDFFVKSLVLLAEIFDLLVFLFHIGVKFFPGTFFRLNKQTLSILEVFDMLDQSRILFSEPWVEHIKGRNLTEKRLLILFDEFEWVFGGWYKLRIWQVEGVILLLKILNGLLLQDQFMMGLVVKFQQHWHLLAHLGNGCLLKREFTFELGDCLTQRLALTIQRPVLILDLTQQSHQRLVLSFVQGCVLRVNRWLA